MWLTRKMTERYPRYDIEEAMLPDGNMGWELIRTDIGFECTRHKRIALLANRAEIERLRDERTAERDAHECHR